MCKNELEDAKRQLNQAGYAASKKAVQRLLDRYADDPRSVTDDVARAAATVSYAAAVGMLA